MVASARVLSKFRTTSRSAWPARLHSAHLRQQANYWRTTTRSAPAAIRSSWSGTAPFSALRTVCRTATSVQVPPTPRWASASATARTCATAPSATCARRTRRATAVLYLRTQPFADWGKNGTAFATAAWTALPGCFAMESFRSSVELLARPWTAAMEILAIAALGFTRATRRICAKNAMLVYSARATSGRTARILHLRPNALISSSASAYLGRKWRSINCSVWPAVQESFAMAFLNFYVEILLSAPMWKSVPMA